MFTVFHYHNDAELKVQLGNPEKNYQRATLLVFDIISIEYYMATGSVLCNLFATTVNHRIDTIQTYNVLYIL